jgi:hypothetical protein
MNNQPHHPGKPSLHLYFTKLCHGTITSYSRHRTQITVMERFHLPSFLGVRNKVIVLLNWVWNYFTYDQSMRMIVYARKAKEIRDREKVEETTHWGKELVQEEKNPSITSSSK